MNFSKIVSMISYGLIIGWVTFALHGAFDQDFNQYNIVVISTIVGLFAGVALYMPVTIGLCGSLFFLGKFALCVMSAQKLISIMPGNTLGGLLMDTALFVALWFPALYYMSRDHKQKIA